MSGYSGFRLPLPVRRRLQPGASGILVVDSGFAPNIYWQSVDQAATCVWEGFGVPDRCSAPTPVAPDGVTAGCCRSDGRQYVGGPVPRAAAGVRRVDAPGADHHPLRAAHWCAQIGHSRPVCGTSRAVGSDARQRGYEGRVDLGSTEPGDGFRFPWARGGCRSPAAITTPRCRCGRSPKRLVTSPTYFVDIPNELGGDRFAGLGCAWYWTIARPS